MNLAIPPKKGIIYEDSKLAICLAGEQLAAGHTLVVWKAKVPSLHLLAHHDYVYLLQKTEEAARAVQKVLKCDTVRWLHDPYAKKAHWQLVPSFNMNGYTFMLHQPQVTEDYSLAAKIAPLIGKKV